MLSSRDVFTQSDPSNSHVSVSARHAASAEEAKTLCIQWYLEKLASRYRPPRQPMQHSARERDKERAGYERKRQREGGDTRRLDLKQAFTRMVDIYTFARPCLL